MATPPATNASLVTSGPSGSGPDNPEDPEGSPRPPESGDGGSSEDRGAGDSADIGRETVSGISWQAAANLVQFVARFGFSIVLARILLPDDFGVVAVATLATGFASTLTDLGLGPALIQRKSVSQGHIRSCFTFSTLSALAMGTLLFVSAGALASLFNEPRVEPVLRLLAITFPLAGVSITSRALLTRDLRFKTMVKIQLGATIVGSGFVSVILAWLGFGYWALVWGQLGQGISSSLLTYAAARHSLRPLFAAEPFKDLFGFSFGMSLTSTVNYFALQGDYFVIGRMMDSAALGFYSRAYSLMQLPLSFLGGAISRVMFPVASRVQDQPERFRRAFLATFKLSLAFALPVSLALGVLAPELIVALYGEKWARTVPLLQILSLFGVFRMTYNSAAAFVRAKGQVYRLLLSQLFYATVVLGGSWYGATVGGLEGVAWGVGGAIVVMWTMVVGFALAAAGVGLLAFVREMTAVSLPALGISAATFGAAWGLRSLDVGSWGVLLVAGPLFAVLFAGYLIIQGRRIDHPAIHKILGRIPGISRWAPNPSPTGR